MMRIVELALRSLANGASLPMTFLKRINTLLGHIETALLCLLILLMIGMALLKIVLRYLFHTGILWNDVMLQHFTLWLAFLGAALATGEKRHISIDVFARLLPARLVRLTTIIIHLISLAVVGILVDASIDFLRSEQVSRTTLVGTLPLWWAKIIIPLGFILIAVHFAVHILMAIISQAKD
ncbi:MAG: TRAP transporter small permease [Candidatus Poribacteria bacterium]|nr:TRAP transporter small permease [Candidatus Poribacteria bacterium]